MGRESVFQSVDSIIERVTDIRQSLAKLFFSTALLFTVGIGYADTLNKLMGESPKNFKAADSPTVEAVTFKSGKYTLRGRLITPRQLDRKVPAIIFCTGSGGESSSFTTTYYDKFLDSLFENNLPADSLAFLYFDKPGVGGSEGKWYKRDFEQRADDVKAAADYLKTLANIDSSRIAVAGHSQGGWISQICLSKYPTTFAGGISMAGPTFGVKEQVINDYTSSIMCKAGIPEKEAHEKAIKKVRADLLLTSLLPLKEEWKQLNVIKKFQPDSFLRSVNKPLLLMFGENDALVSPHRSSEKLNQLFPEKVPSNIQVVTVKGANHGFKLSEMCYSGPYSKIPFSPDGKQHIRNWVSAVLLK